MSAEHTTTPRRRRNPRGLGGRLAEEIIETGRQIIEETGDESRVTLSEIARRLGIAAPSVYSHFSGVDEICRQVVGRAWEEYRSATTDGGSDAPPGERLHHFARAYVTFARTRWGLYRVLFCRSSPSPVPGVGEAARADFARLAGGVGLVLGVAADSPEAWDSAIGLWIQLHGIASLPPVHPRFAWPDDEGMIIAALKRSGLY